MELRGSVYKPGRSGSIIEVVRIEGKIFKTMKEPEAHGLELAQEWVDAAEKDKFQQFQPGAEIFRFKPSRHRSRAR